MYLYIHDYSYVCNYGLVWFWFYDYFELPSSLLFTRYDLNCISLSDIMYQHKVQGTITLRVRCECRFVRVS